MRAGKGELAQALEQLLAGHFAKPVILRSYSLDDFVTLLTILGKETARQALQSALVIYNAIVLDIGVPLYFYPKSLWANETLVIDADGWWRLPYCVAYPLALLQAGVDAQGNDLSHFSIAPTGLGMNIPLLYRAAAGNWWATIGQECLSQERIALEAFL